MDTPSCDPGVLVGYGVLTRGRGRGLGAAAGQAGDEPARRGGRVQLHVDHVETDIEVLVMFHCERDPTAHELHSGLQPAPPW